METVSFIIMDNLFNEYAYTEEYKNIILEPLNADEMLNVNYITLKQHRVLYNKLSLG